MILPELSGAKEIAVLVKCMPNIEDCAALIEQYAQTVASGAKLDASQAMYDGIMARIGEQMRAG